MTDEERLTEQYMGLVRAKASHYFLPGAEQDDVFQEGMIGLLQAIRNYRPDAGCSFPHFANLCITGQILKALEAAGRLKSQPLNTAESLDNVANAAVTEATDPEELLLRREQLLAWQKLVEKRLSPFEKQVLDVYLTDKTYREIGAVLGLSEKQVNNALQRVRKKLFSENKV